MAKSFFEKLGKSLSLEDEQYEDTFGEEKEVEEAQDPVEETVDLPAEEATSEDSGAAREESAPDEEPSLDDFVQEESNGTSFDEGPRVTLASTTKVRKAKTTHKKTTAQKKKTVHKESHLEEGQLTIDVYETDDEIVIKSTIAGIDSDDIDINITQDSVSIRGIRTKDEEVKTKDYFYQECYWGAFSRSIILPSEINPDKSVASLTNGILTIRLPKLSRSQQKKLKVKTS